MNLDAITGLCIMILGILVAIAPWTFAPVCAAPMQCWTTRNVETVLGAIVAILGFVVAYRVLE